jgi:hypothetical protein
MPRVVVLLNFGETVELWLNENVVRVRIGNGPWIFISKQQAQALQKELNTKLLG